MSTQSSTPSSKLIFAPAASSSGQADQYQKGTLTRTDLSPSPFTQFHAWFRSAQENSVYQPETICLSTSHLPTGSVSSRFVYLKELDPRGFVIYSNWGTSRKAKDVESNAKAALAFWWREQERQVRVEGRVERLSREESQRYFDVRARGSRVGAWASKQSEVLREEEGGRDVLDGWVKEVEQRFEGEDKIPVPEFWGGLRVLPDMIEFWQGRDSRLHDRFKYTRNEGKTGEGSEEGQAEQWTIERLSP